MFHAELSGLVERDGVPKPGFLVLGWNVEFLGGMREAGRWGGVKDQVVVR